MGDFGALGLVAVLAAITYAYFLYIRPAFGKTGATVLAVLVFFLLVVLMGDRACSAA